MFGIDNEKLAEVLEHIKKFNNRSEASKQLLKEDAIGYSATRNRQLRQALLSGDQETVDEVVEDVAAVIGEKNAEWWKITAMEKIVAESLEKQSRRKIK